MNVFYSLKTFYNLSEYLKNQNLLNSNIVLHITMYTDAGCVCFQKPFFNAHTITHIYVLSIRSENKKIKYENNLLRG